MNTQLRYDQGFHRYVLNDPDMRSDYNGSYEMVIEHLYSTEYSYRFICWQDGDWSEVITQDQLNEKVKDVADHEGDEVASIFRQNHPYVVVGPTHPVFKLQKKWEAFMELGLTVPVVHGTWQSKPFSQEVINEMNEARDRYVGSWAEWAVG